MDLSTLIRYSPTALHLLNGGSPTSSGSYGHLSPGALSPALVHSAHLQQLQVLKSALTSIKIYFIIDLSSCSNFHNIISGSSNQKCVNISIFVTSKLTTSLFTAFVSCSSRSGQRGLCSILSLTLLPFPEPSNRLWPQNFGGCQRGQTWVFQCCLKHYGRWWR